MGPKLAKSGFVGLHFTGVATRPGRTLTVKRTCAFLLRGRLSDNLSVSASVARCHSPASLALPAVDPHTRPRASATSMADNAFTGARGEPDLLMSKTHEKDTLDDASSGENVHGGPRELTAAEEKILSSAYLKLDLFFLSTLTFIYWLNFLDRANIGNARAAGRYLAFLPRFQTRSAMLTQRNCRLAGRPRSLQHRVFYSPYCHLHKLPLCRMAIGHVLQEDVRTRFDTIVAFRLIHMQRFQLRSTSSMCRLGSRLHFPRIRPELRRARRCS